MDTRLTPFDNIGRDQLGQILQPQAGCFDLAMPKLPRLNNLVRFTVKPRHDTDWVLNGDALYGCFDEGQKEINSMLLFNLLIFKPASTAHSEMSAGRMSDHQIPPKANCEQHVFLKMEW